MNGSSGYVSDAWVYTGTANAVAGTCSSIPPPPPALSRTKLPYAVARKPYSTTFSTARGARPYRYSVVTKSLPPGLTLSRGGRLSGSPTKHGSYSFTVTVSDGESPAVTAQAGYTIVVRPLAVRTTTLPKARRQHAYRAQLRAWSDSGRLTWAIAAKQLPKGVHLSKAGLISGKPSRDGVSRFTVRVRDAAGHTAERALALTVG